MIYFISFGSDIKFELLSFEVLRSLSITYPNSFIKIYSTAELPIEFQEYATLYKRGFGYWIWKPYIINRTLENLSEEDILVYVDGRSGMPETGKPIRWFDTFLLQKNYDIAAWQMEHIEKQWTTQELVSLLITKDPSEVMNSGQYSATFHAWRVNNRTRHLAKSWLEFILKKPELCRDEPSRIPNDVSFRENRHDQSVFSLLVKDFSESQKISTMTLSDEVVCADNLHHGVKRHPKQRSFLKSLFRKRPNWWDPGIRRAAG